MIAHKKISILRVPFDLGAGTKGVDLGPYAILHAGLTRRISQLGMDSILEEELIPPQTTQSSTLYHAKNLEAVIHVNNKLANKVSTIVENGHFPLILGGDHSIAIGTLAGLTQHFSNLGVIWFDAHSDLNTEGTSPSGNIHGMSLAVALGRGHSDLVQIQGTGRINPKNVVIIGARQIDHGEKEFIRALGINCFTMQDIDRLGMGNVMEKALILLRDTDGVHLSFDVDSLDPIEAPGTGTPVKGGVSYREAHFALELLHDSGLVTSAEFVEVNPSLDSDNKTAQLVVDFIATLFGKQIL